MGMPKKAPSRDTEYHKYLASGRWKSIRQKKLAQAGYCCERCKCTANESALEVHHKSYDHFGNEPLTDLEVLCAECHPVADDIRRVEQIVYALSRDNISHKLRSGWLGWMKRSYGYDWADQLSQFGIVREARSYLAHIGLDDDNPVLIAKTIGVHWIKHELVAQIAHTLDDIDRGAASFDFSGVAVSDAEKRIEQFRKMKEREADMRLLGAIFSRPHLDEEIDGCDFRLQTAGISYKRYRIEFNGPTAGQPVLVKEWNPRN